MARQKCFLPVETDSNVSVRGFIDSDWEIQVVFVVGERRGYISAGLFRHMYDKTGEDGYEVSRAPIHVSATENVNGIEMHVEVQHPGEEKIVKTFGPEVCDEVMERIDQMQALLHTYGRRETLSIPSSRESAADLHQAVADDARRQALAS